MKTLLATIVGLGLLSGTANAQFVRIITPGYVSAPEICLPGVSHHYLPGSKLAHGEPAQTAEAPAEAAPEAPAEEAPADKAPLQAPLPPK